MKCLNKILLDLLTKTIDFSYPETLLENRIKLIPREFCVEKWKTVINKLKDGMNEQGGSNHEGRESRILREVDDFLANFEEEENEMKVLSIDSLLITNSIPIMVPTTNLSTATPKTGSKKSRKRFSDATNLQSQRRREIHGEVIAEIPESDL